MTFTGKTLEELRKYDLFKAIVMGILIMLMIPGFKSARAEPAKTGAAPILGFNLEKPQAGAKATDPMIYSGTTNAPQLALAVDGVTVKTVYPQLGQWSFLMPLNDVADKTVSIIEIGNSFQKSVSHEIPGVDKKSLSQKLVMTSPGDGEVRSIGLNAFKGFANPKAEVKVYVDKWLVGTTYADELGKWTLECTIHEGNRLRTTYAECLDLSDETKHISVGFR